MENCGLCLWGKYCQFKAICGYFPEDVVLGIRTVGSGLLLCRYDLYGDRGKNPKVHSEAEVEGQEHKGVFVSWLLAPVRHSSIRNNA